MHLKYLSISQYKNISYKTYDFESKINCFIGDNGKGKSNILDAIYNLSFGKSYFNTVAVQNIQFGKDYYTIEGRYDRENQELKILSAIKKGQKKILKKNGKIYDKISDHIGLIPTVIITPADRNLILEGSETRRKFIDGVIGQTNSLFLQKLIDYNKILIQRNSLLKFFYLNNTFDSNTIDIYNKQLVERSQLIFEKRKEFLENFIPVFKRFYKYISGKNENISINYESHLFDDSHISLLEKSIKKDRLVQYTSTGIHKDDIIFLLEKNPIKKFGSQGQQKTFLIALKLAQFEFLKNQTGQSPILLFDDAFDKLDQNRVTQIISLVDEKNFGQIFITDTHKDRILKALKKIKSSFEIYKLI